MYAAAIRKVRAEGNRSGAPPHALGKAGFDTMFKDSIQEEILSLSTLDIKKSEGK